ncbi:GIY-YIG nuclease family protein [Salegentibacter echinorum]|uniref:GIY-YIG nuclease family protein n=1 Tax=Salegentibacter echinorum TaxID=1073325 RepID=UPI00093480DF|nr:GIY-YIG nuclease family protein [Salegentibacter echinorum]
MYFVYILKSKLDHSFYIGQTNDLNRRLLYHNDGKSRYTSRKIPWEIVYFEKFNTRKDAIFREKFLKKQRNTEFYNRLIKNWSGSSVG